MLKRYLLTTLLLLGVGVFLYADKITKFDVNVTVKQSGELTIIESIDYDFQKSKRHGIFRDIPFTIKNNGHIIDLGLYNFSTTMDNAPIQWHKSTMHSSSAGEIVRLKIGSESNYLSGKHHFIIRYNVKLGVIPASQNSKKDAIRWNIVGTGWKIPIYNIESIFTLPNSLSQDNISVSIYTGKYGSKISQSHSSWITSKKLMVQIDKLNPLEGATVELAYSAGTLDQSGSDNVKTTFMDWFLRHWHWGALIGFLLYFKSLHKRYTGFEDNRSIAVKYLPPKDLSILQSGLILDKFADNEDFSAAILELAHLGYLTIEQESKKADPILKRTDKEVENLTSDQRYLLNSTLFKSGKTYILSKGSEDKAKKLLKNFQHINDNLYNWSVNSGYMMENPQDIRKKFLIKSFLAILPMVALTLYTIYALYGENAVLASIFPVVFGGVGIYIMLKDKKLYSKIFGLAFSSFGILPIFDLHENGLNIQTFFFSPIAVLIILLIVIAMIYKHIGEFTQKGAYTATDLLGLKEYIKRVKKDEIERVLRDDPIYLEKLLPYAVLFDLTDHWLSFYDVLNVDTPYWYVGNLHNMNNFSNSLNMASTPPNTSSNGGGGFSGSGGFSGGGGGGGGGGSW